MSGANSDKTQEADKLMKKANKEISPSFFDFRLKADWEAAAPMLDKAALLYKQAGATEKAIEAYERAAQAQEKIGSAWHAAKHLEVCAELWKSRAKWDQVASCYKQAADLYVQSGKAATGADALARGGRALEEKDVGEALKLYFEAIDLYEMDGKEIQGYDVYRQAIGALVKAKKYHDAVELQLRFGAACEKGNATNSQCKAYLGAVVTHLFAGNGKAAWATFQDCLNVQAFVTSEEAFAADALFNAYRSRSEGTIKQYIAAKSGLFKNLDNHVARLAMKLPNGDLDAIAQEVDQVMGGKEEEGDEYDDAL